MRKVTVVHKGRVKELSPTAMQEVLVAFYQEQVLKYTLKFQRARNKFRKMEYKGIVAHFNGKLAEANVDTSVKLDN